MPGQETGKKHRRKSKKHQELTVLEETRDENESVEIDIESQAHIKEGAADPSRDKDLRGSLKKRRKSKQGSGRGEQAAAHGATATGDE